MRTAEPSTEPTPGGEMTAVAPGPRGWWTPMMVFLLGAMLSLGAFHLVRRAEESEDEANFLRRQQVFLSAMREHRAGVEDVMKTLRALFTLVPDLTLTQFHEAIRDLAIRTGGVQALLWAPSVSAADRERFEAVLSATGTPGSVILEGDVTHPESDRPVRALEREEYLPVRFVEPLEGNTSIVGYDIASLPALAATIRGVRENGDVRVSGPIPLPYRGRAVAGFLAFVPVYRTTLRPATREQRLAEFRGCVVAVFVFEEVMAWIAERAGERQMDVLLVEEAADGASRVLGGARGTGEEVGDSEGLALEEMLASPFARTTAGLSGQSWFLYFRRGPDWPFTWQRWTSVAVAVVGLMVTSWLAWSLAGAQHRTRVVERLVGERTLELGSANRRLEEENRERLRAEESLSEERNFLRTLLDRLPAMVFVCDRQGRYLLVNDLHRRRLGLATEGDALLRRVREVGPASMAAALADCCEGGLVDHQELDREISVTLEGDEVRHLSVSRLPLPNGGGTVERLVVLVRDVTEARRVEGQRQEFERHLQETQRLESLGLMAGGIAHDFNNLLTTALGNVGLARMDLPAISPVAPYLDEIEKMANRAADLCRQMLAFSGRGHFTVRELDFNRLITETVDLVRFSISKKVRLRLDLCPDLPPVRGDATQLRQVLMNLVINGAEAIGTGDGTVRLSTCVQRAGDEPWKGVVVMGEVPRVETLLCVEVRDNGSGMEPETLKKVFDPFFSTKFQGRGLGLAAVLGITRSHQGAIAVDSAPGEGTTFRLWFPAADGVEVAADEEASVPEVKWMASGSVLVVDDEEAVRTIARRALERTGMTVHLAADGREGLDRFTSDPSLYQAVLLDLTMPRLNGEESLREIRRLRPGVPVLLMSGYVPRETPRHFPGEGPVGFLQKPFGPEQLVTALRPILSPVDS